MNALWLRIRPLLSTFVRYIRISYLEAKSGYEGTVLGILWMPVSTLVFALLLGLVFHGGGARSWTEFFLYVLSGYVCWNFISESVSRSIDIIQTKFDFAVHNNLTLAGLYGKMLADRVFAFGLEFMLLIAACLVLGFFGFGWPLLMLVPLLVLLAATSLAISYLVNLATILVPDLGNVIRTGVRLMFFATPVFWEAAGRTDIRGVLEAYNPASYYLMMMRQVVGVDPFSWSVWGIGAIIAAVISITGIVAYRWSRSFVRNLR